jgi:hypothetical protein
MVSLFLSYFSQSYICCTFIFLVQIVASLLMWGCSTFFLPSGTQVLSEFKS